MLLLVIKTTARQMCYKNNWIKTIILPPNVQTAFLYYLCYIVKEGCQRRSIISKHGQTLKKKKSERAVYWWLPL